MLPLGHPAGCYEGRAHTRRGFLGIDTAREKVVRDHLPQPRAGFLSSRPLDAKRLSLREEPFPRVNLSLRMGLGTRHRRTKPKPAGAVASHSMPVP